MVTNYATCHAGCRVAAIDLDQVREVDTSDGRSVWIGLQEPDQPPLRTVQQRFGLHDLAVEDALRAHQRPELEIYGDTLFHRAAPGLAASEFPSSIADAASQAGRARP
jgi:magnesium transporter